MTTKCQHGKSITYPCVDCATKKKDREIAVLRKRLATLRLDAGLAAIELEEKKRLLASCEAALVERDTKLEELEKDKSRLDFMGLGWFENGRNSDCDDENVHIIWEITGSRNDREFNPVGEAPTLRRAIDNAMGNIRGRDQCIAQSK